MKPHNRLTPDPAGIPLNLWALDLDPGRATFVRYDTRLQVSQDRAQAWKLVHITHMRLTYERI